MKKRNIIACIVLTFVTCGIYGIYWFVQLTNNVNELAQPEKKTSGGVALLLYIITCGLYGIYWAYKMGDLLDKAAVAKGKQSENRAIIYLVLQIVIAIAGWALMQNSINNMIEN